MPRKSHAKKVRGPKIQVGNHTFTYGKGLNEIDDSTDLWVNGDFKTLRYKLETDGYIFVRGVIPQNIAIKARNMMLTQAKNDGSVINTKDINYMEARMAKQKEYVYFFIFNVYC